jgi:hypothetical protein
LGSLGFPAAPAPIVAGGTDSVSSAINETLPIIESPVIDGLPAVKAALARTGSSISVAASMYADTDQRLGDHISQVQFLSAEEMPAGDAPLGATGRFGAAADDKDKDEDKKPTPTPTPKPNTMAQFGQFAGAASTFAQSMQGVMQGMQSSLSGLSSAGSAPAELASDTTKVDDAPADRGELVDEIKGDGEEPTAEGAAQGNEASGSAPVEAPAPGRPQTTAAEIEL